MQKQWWPPTGERLALPCPLVSYLYPLPWTDVTVGLKLNMLLSHYSTVGGAQGGCLLKSGSRHIHSSHKRAVKLCLTSLWPCSRVWSSSSPKGNPCLALDICAGHLHPAGAGQGVCDSLPHTVQEPLVYQSEPIIFRISKPIV